MNVVDKAQAFALRHHFGKANKHDGEPYVLHLLRVFVAVRDAGGSEEDQAIAWLHDVVEDTDAEFFDLVDAGFSEYIVTGVMLLSKTGRDIDDETYYMRIRDSGHRGAILVKNCDMKDNFRRNHLITDPDKRLKFAARYSLGTDILGG